MYNVCTSVFYFCFNSAIVFRMQQQKFEKNLMQWKRHHNIQRGVWVCGLKRRIFVVLIWQSILQEGTQIHTHWRAGRQGYSMSIQRKLRCWCDALTRNFVHKAEVITAADWLLLLPIVCFFGWFWWCCCWYCCYFVFNICCCYRCCYFLFSLQI